MRWKLVLFVLVTALVLAEAVARLAFVSPYSSIRPRPNIPHYQSDIKLGWKNNPGNYAIDFLDRVHARTIRVAIGKHGERVSFPNTVQGPQADILFVGDSWTFGEAVQGQEAFPGITAKAIPKNYIINLGVGGYSTYQALLQLESLDWDVVKPKHVFYGLLSFHEDRNVASKGWVRSLSKSSQGQDARLPFVSISSDLHVERQDPLAVSFFPDLCKFSSFICIGLHAYWRIHDEWRPSQKTQVTRRLIDEMGVLVTKHHSKFTVLLLDPDSFRYESYLRARGIDYLRIEGQFGRLSYDAHPDFAFHTVAAQRILEKIQR